MPSKASRIPWVLLILILVIAIAPALNDHKVPPVMSLLMKLFHMSAKQGGSLMSIFAFMALVFGLPAGFIFQKMGYRLAGSIGLLATVAGSFLGALSASYGSLFFSRCLEAVGLAFLSVVLPAVIGQRMPKGKKGLAMGAYALHMPLGTFFAFAIAPALVSRWGWQGLWWFGALYAAAMFIVFIVLVRPAPVETARQIGSGAQTQVRDRAALRNPGLWMLVLMWVCFSILVQGIVTWLPAYLVRIQHYTLAQAAFVMSLRTFCILPSNLVGGYLTDRFGWRIVCVVPMFIDAMAFPLSAFFTGLPLYGLMVIQGLVGGFIAPSATTGISEVAGPGQQGMGMGMMTVGRTVGNLIGPIALGTVIDSWGWIPAFILFCPVAVFGGLSALFIFKMKMGQPAAGTITG